MRKIVILSLSGVALAALATPALAQDISIAVAGPMTGPLATIGAADETRRRSGSRGDQRHRRGQRQEDQDRRRGRCLRSETGSCGRQPHRRPADQVRRRPRLLGLVDSGLRGLCREQHPDDDPGLVESAAHRERPSDRYAPLRPRRRAGRIHRAIHRREVQGQEDRDPARQVGLRQRPRHGGEGQAERRRGHRGHVRGHQPGR